SLFAVRPEDAAPPARIHTLSLPDALPILTPWSGEHAMAAPPTTAWDSEWVSVRTGPSWSGVRAAVRSEDRGGTVTAGRSAAAALDRKSTRLNSSHGKNSYAAICLERKT